MWHQIHISHRGAYSIERLAAFDEFCRKTSAFRALVTCLMLPIPALVIAVLIELIPLRDPREGWKANYSAWIRELFATFGIGVGFIVQTSALLPLLAINSSQVLCIASFTSIFATALQVGVASAWVYPIPFGFILVAPAFFTILFVSFIIVVRKRLRDPDFVHSLRQQLFVLVIQGFFAVVYCAFCAAYYNLSPSAQPFFVLGLPIVKFTMQHAVAWTSSHISEYVPGITVFSVEVFNALYVAKCMQNAGSPLTNVLLIALDVFHGVRSFRHMNRSMSRLSQMIALGNKNLVHEVLTICRQPNVLSSISEQRDICVRSSLQLSLSENGSNFISQLERYQFDQQGTKELLNARSCDAVPLTPHNASRQVRDQPNLNVLKSESSHKNIATTNLPRRCSLATISKKQELIHQGLKLFFQCEYHALVEYVECVIPMVYTVYIAILCQLPSAEYQPETRHLATERVRSMITNIIIYACWEMLSLVVLHVAVRWRFGFSLLHLLAFVLHSRFTEFQGRLLAIFSYIFSVTVVHYGTSQFMRTV